MRALVLGAGISGKAASRLLTRLRMEHRIYDRRADALEDPPAGVETAGGEWDRSMLAGVSLVVASPGFMPHLAPLTDVRAAGIPIWSEVELAVRHLDCPVIAITGTNGKTTVCRQTTEMLAESGIRAVAAGNIGVPISDVRPGTCDVVVLEISSFQLHYTYSLAPRVSVFMNVADDHVDWHRSLIAYRLAKGRISRHLTDEDLLVYDVGDPGAVAHALGAPGRRAPVTGSEPGPGPEGPFGFSVDGLAHPGGAVPIREIPDLDYSFRVNLAASAVAAIELGADPAAVARVVARFRHRHHRRTEVGSLGDVTWVDDSKATNPHAAMAAIRSYPSVVLIAGGVRKGLDLSPLVQAPNVRYMVAIGECGPDLVEMAADLPTALAGSMEEAVRMASDQARAGDTVLLSPGTTGFDMFTCYEHRGNVFIQHVDEYLGRVRAGRDPRAAASRAASG